MTTEGKVSPLPLSKRITPLPWRTDDFYCGYIWSGDKMVADFPMDEDEGTYLARMRGVGRGASRDEQIANAHFIVRAVNAHDRLVEAIERFIAAANDSCDASHGHNDVAAILEYNTAFTELSAALAAAKGGK